ncbi:MAG: amidohydrolase family protein [Gemmatimonadaceae bacterium]
MTKRVSQFALLISGTLLSAIVALPHSAGAQRLRVAPAVRSYVKIDTAILALTNVRVIDGTGAAAREGQTIIVRDGKIAAVGAAATVQIPAGAQTINLQGKTVMPGLVMVHEHLFYPTGPGVYGNFAESYSRLYLAGGVTSMRTGGNMGGFHDIELSKASAAGDRAAPFIDATAPYLEGQGLGLLQVRPLTDAADATRQVNYWADMGATSFKAYMNISREELGAAIKAAHARGLKVTGHLCSVTYREAADLGIDDLEHGFFAANDFVPNKQPDKCVARGGAAQTTVAAIDAKSPEAQALFKYLIAKNVTLTSTLTIFETFTPGRPISRGLDMLLPELKATYEQRYEATQKQTNSNYAKLFPNGMAMELAFAKAGGTLVVGTDPTGGGGLVAGFSNQRALELLVEAGFTPLEAIKIATLNGANYLGRGSLTGSIAVGKLADMVVINGNPAMQISDVRNVETVFRQGIGFDPAALIESVRGKAGLF